MPDTATWFSISLEPVRTARYYPVARGVFFDAAEETIPERYVQFRRPEEANAFRPEELLGDDLSYQYHLLNLVGRHLRENPDYTVQIQGWCPRCSHTAGDSVARRRARRVAEYLQTIWKIDPYRTQARGNRLPWYPERKRNPPDSDDENRVDLWLIPPFPTGAEEVPLEIAEQIEPAKHPFPSIRNARFDGYTALRGSLCYLHQIVERSGATIPALDVYLDTNYLTRIDLTDSLWDIRFLHLLSQPSDGVPVVKPSAKELRFLPTATEPLVPTFSLSGRYHIPRPDSVVTISILRYPEQNNEYISRVDFMPLYMGLANIGPRGYLMPQLKGLPRAERSYVIARISATSVVDAREERLEQIAYRVSMVVQSRLTGRSHLKVHPENIILTSHGRRLLPYDNGTPEGRVLNGTIRTTVAWYADSVRVPVIVVAGSEEQAGTPEGPPSVTGSLNARCRRHLPRHAGGGKIRDAKECGAEPVGDAFECSAEPACDTTEHSSRPAGTEQSAPRYPPLPTCAFSIRGEEESAA